MPWDVKYCMQIFCKKNFSWSSSVQIPDSRFQIPELEMIHRKYSMAGISEEVHTICSVV
jgi:hypothetical protein